MMSSKVTIRSIQPAQRWRQDCAEHIFPTKSSWEWFKRSHFEKLIASGELIPGRGRRGDLVGENIDQVVIDILRSELNP